MLNSAIDVRAVGDGAFVRAGHISDLVIDEADLRCIDLVHGPNLRSVDLRACRQPVHLTVSGCPNLERVWLPSSGEGACVHWDFGEGGKTVTIEGSIELFDCSFGNKRSAHAQASKLPYSSARIYLGEIAEELLRACCEAELVISSATTAVDAGELQKLNPKVRALHLIGGDLPSTCELFAPNLECVTIVDSRELDELVASTSVERLTLVRCSRVSRIVNVGHLLRVEGCRTPELKLEGAWNRAHFVQTTSRLVSGPIEEISSHGCPHIHPEIVSLANASNPLAFLPSEDCIHDPKWRALLIGWISRTTSRATILPALKLISALIESGLPPDAGWELRSKLAANTARKAFKARCQDSWSWDATEDLAFETYTEDLSLWLRCRDASGASDHREKLCSARGAMQISALVRQARSSDGEARDHCLQAALHAIERIRSRGNFEGTDGQITVAIKRIVEALVPARAQPQARAILVSLPRFVAIIASDVVSLEVLSKLAALGLRSANVELIRRARSLAAEQSDLAAHFHAAAFAPRVSTILADVSPEVSHA